ncbi:MAG: AAA-like domain-containing protein [Cyanobacteria bacterium P01_F01_bin.86]
MTVEDALALVNSALAPQYVNDAQELVFRQCWQGRTYQEIAEISGYTHDHIRWVGSQLWQSLSEALGEKTTKSNFRTVLQRHQQRDLSESKPVASSQDHAIWEQAMLTASVLEPPTGPVSIGSRLYVERSPLETHCYEAILQPGALIRIKAARKMGKTSLMTRILHHAQKSGYRTTVLNMRQANLGLLNDPNRFLFWFCASVTYALNLPNKLEEYWDDIFGGNSNSTHYFEKYLLPELNAPLVLAIDDTDIVFQHPEIATDFLGLLRAWYEKAKYGVNNSAIWQKLRLVVIHSTEVYVPLTARQSPFNVGLSIELPELTPAQIMDLATRYLLSGESNIPVDFYQNHIVHLAEQVGGNPYLLQLAFHYLLQNDLALETLASPNVLEFGIYQEILRQQWQTLQQYPELMAAYQQVIHSPTPIKLAPKIIFELQSLGLVRLDEAGVVPVCQIYRAYFNDHLNHGIPTESYQANSGCACSK